MTISQLFLSLSAVVSLVNTGLAAELGFVELFDGKSLAGWTGSTESYSVEEGVLACHPGGSSKLYTESEYDDFELRFEFQLTPGANNGLGIRAPLGKNAAYHGIELQILDDSAEKYANLRPYQFHGSAYGIAPAKRGALKPVGEWNQQTVICQGRHIHVTLNGTVILDIDLDGVAPNGETIDGKAHPGLTNTTGHIGLLGHGDRVLFRHIQVKEQRIQTSNATLESTEK